MSITRGEALDRVKRIICETRCGEYGEPENLFGLIAQDWSRRVGVTVTPAQVAGMMADLKDRRAEANPQHLDSRIDAIGYRAIEIELLKLESEPTPDAEGWIENTGVQPVAGDVPVDVKLRSGNEFQGTPAHMWRWDERGSGTITHWRLAR